MLIVRPVHPPTMVVLTGAPGVGKSTAGVRLAARMSCPTLLVEVDALGSLFPWIETRELYELICSNLSSLLDHATRRGIRDFILVGVLIPGNLLDPVMEVVNKAGITSRGYALRARPDILTSRICNDAASEAATRLEDRGLDDLLHNFKGHQLDTVGLTPPEVVESILAAEAPHRVGQPLCERIDAHRIGPLIHVLSDCEGM